MGNLLKLTFFRLGKSKAFIIMAVLAVVAALLFPLGQLFFSLFLPTDVVVATDYSSYILKVYSVSYFSFMSSWVGPVVFIMLGMGIATYIRNEVRSGAIRNHVTSGYSRTKIYYAHYIPCMTMAIGAILTSQILIGLIGLIGGSDFEMLRNGTDLFYPRYFIGLIGFIGLLTIVFSFAMRFNSPAFPSLMANLILPMIFTISNLTILLVFINSQMTVMYDGQPPHDFIKAISWIPMQQYEVIVNYSSSGDITSLIDFGFTSLDYGIIYKGLVSVCLLYAGALVSGHLLYNRKEFK